MFYGTFNNIVNVLGTRRDETLAVHLVKTYCLPSSELSIGWVDPRVGLGWVGNGSKICVSSGLGWVMGLK